MDFLKNKKISILGDSISTFEGYSNDINSNTTIGNNRVYYGGVDHTGFNYIVDVNNTWWKMMLDDASLKLVVNNSWSGSLVLDSRIQACGYASRSNNLHNDITNERPDIILIYLGTNDACNHIEIGEYDKDNINEFIKSKNAPTNFIEAYALMINNIISNYKDAKIYCMSLLPFINLTEKENKQYNQVIYDIVNHFNLDVIDLYHNCKVESNLTYFAENGYVHPNETGMKEIFYCVKDKLITQRQSN